MKNIVRVASRIVNVILGESTPSAIDFVRQMRFKYIRL
jgi:hypothetical protein